MALWPFRPKNVFESRRDVIVLKAVVFSFFPFFWVVDNARAGNINIILANAHGFLLKYRALGCPGPT